TATPLLGSAPVVVFQPLRAATTPPAAAVPVRNALRVRSVSDLGLLPAEQSRSSITAHLLFLPPNDRRSAAEPRFGRARRWRQHALGALSAGRENGRWGRAPQRSMPGACAWLHRFRTW